MHKIYHVTLTDDERSQLDDIISKGKAAARVQTHARILLKAEEAPTGPGWTDEQISAALAGFPQAGMAHKPSTA
jgi:hypothetical protein